MCSIKQIVTSVEKCISGDRNRTLLNGDIVPEEDVY